MAKSDDEEQLPLNLQGGSNITKVKKDVAAIDLKITKIEEQMAALAEQKQAHRDDIKAMGIPKGAFDKARRDKAMDPDKREENDMGYQIAREALGITLHPFETADDKADKNPASAPKASSAKKPSAKKAATKKAAKPKAPKAEKANGAGDSNPLAGLDDAISRAEATSKIRNGEKLN
jgi:hypothetical protein